MNIQVIEEIANCKGEIYVWTFQLIGLTLHPIQKVRGKKHKDVITLGFPELISTAPDDIAAQAIQQVTEKITVL